MGVVVIRMRTTIALVAAIGSCALLVVPAAAATPHGHNEQGHGFAGGRVPLPSPVPAYLPTAGDLGPAGASVVVSFRLYLAGRAPTAEGRYALAAATPGTSAYGHYLTAAEFEARFGPSRAQLDAVVSWARASALRVTGRTEHYLAVTGTAPAVSRALATSIHTFGAGSGESGYAPVRGASVPRSVAGDIAEAVHLDSLTYDSADAENPTRPAAAVQSADSARPKTCSQYWGQHSASIPEAYGRTSAPTAVCGYRPEQLRHAYGVSPSDGAGATVAVLLDGRLPTMEADADRFFTEHHLPGFRPGQYGENLGPDFAATCGAGTPDVPEEPLDVETTHMIAPAAKVLYVGTSCGDGGATTQLGLLDGETRIVDGHLADVVTDSYSMLESSYPVAVTAAWNDILEQGAAEGIGFDSDSGDDGDESNGGFTAPAVLFPASDPWATAVGGTTLEIDRADRVSGQQGWGDTVAQINRAGTGYLQPLPGSFSQGSTGGRSNLFAQPSFQRGVVPRSLATDHGQLPAHREVPDVSAAASPITGWLIGYDNGAGYHEALEGGTSGSSPILAALEADAKAGAGHAIGYANPALYRAGYPALVDITAPRTPVISVAPIDDCYATRGPRPISRCLVTVGLDSSLTAAPGYDAVTGMGAATAHLATALARSR